MIIEREYSILINFSGGQMKKLFILTWIWFLLAPLPSGIALNHKTRECGYYRGGDEFAVYRLSADWKIYYPYGGIIKTEIGSCPLNAESTIESCCLSLGYTYVPGNIGEERGHLVWTPVAIVLFCFKLWPLALMMVVFLLILFFARRKGKDMRN